LGFEGLEGDSSQSDALSESEVAESEGEEGAVVEMGTRVRNWAALFFLDRKVLEGVPRRARFWSARANGRMGCLTEAIQERGLRVNERVGLWMLER
jgi:hypothetical protein